MKINLKLIKYWSMKLKKNKKAKEEKMKVNKKEKRKEKRKVLHCSYSAEYYSNISEAIVSYT